MQSLRLSEPTWSLTIDKPQKWINSNQRMHWAERSRLTKYWRELAHRLGQAEKVPTLQRAHIEVTFYKPTRARYDVGNLMPTVKACVDGLVQDAGMLPDDDNKHLTGPHLWASDVPGPRRFVIDVYDLDAEVAA